MPTMERMANEGLRFSRFHTTGLCSPTRQALLTGRNHHSVGMGNITEQATNPPGYTSVRPNSAATIAEVLQTQRLQHRGLWQDAPDARMGSQPVRPL